MTPKLGVCQLMSKVSFTKISHRINIKNTSIHPLFINTVSDHRRGMRRDDPRRHTLGGDMILYAGNQGQQQQRAMDLEVI